MRKIEAILVTVIIALLFLPFILIWSVFVFFMEIYFNIYELFSDSQSWDKAPVTKTYKDYIYIIKKCYNNIAYDD